jgi:hypothetical protein
LGLHTYVKRRWRRGHWVDKGLEGGKRELMMGKAEEEELGLVNIRNKKIMEPQHYSLQM